jgi:hypothetical protein
MLAKPLGSISLRTSAGTLARFTFLETGGRLVVSISMPL